MIAGGVIHLFYEYVGEIENMDKQIGVQRLSSQQVVGSMLGSAQGVAHWMGAIQAQDYKQTLWAIGVRMQQPDLSAVESAIVDGQIVRIWSQRGTIHFIPSVNIKWMLELCASRTLAGHGRRMKQLELTDAIMGQSGALIGNKLAGGQSLTRSEIFEVLEAGGISTAGQRGYHILWHLAHQGLICMTEQAGRYARFALVDEWVTDIHDYTHDEALAYLAETYFVSHGPATDYDFARWSGLTLTDTRKGIELAGSILSSYDHDDMTYWFNESVVNFVRPEQTVCLLPAYDEYLLGYKDRSHVLDDEFADHVCPGNNGVFQPMIVVDGQIVGIWKRKLKAKSIDIELYPFTTLGDARDAVMAEAERYSEFMGLSVTIKEG